MNEVANHAATCQAYQSKHGSVAFDNMMVVSEPTRCGMASILVTQCSGCGEKISFSTSTKVEAPNGKLYWSSNLAAVWGQMATGGGFNPLEESMSVLGIPVMTKKSFVHTEHMIGKWWWDQLEESMKQAGIEEREHAIQQGHYHQGVPAITVVVDAGWSKRTHKHTYNALSAVGVIFGYYTGKLLYVGVRNKFCSICKQGKKEPHTCFKNWEGASASMESDIILEGFKTSEQQHGVRYINFIGDGDSSVHSTLVSGVPGWGYFIQKQECANHALKCYRASLEQLIRDKPQYKGRHKLTESMRVRLTKAARSAIIMRSKLTNKHHAASLLQDDILNAPLHCFGSHHRCKPEYCKVVKHNQSLSNDSTSNSPSTGCNSGPASSTTMVATPDGPAPDLTDSSQITPASSTSFSSPTSSLSNSLSLTDCSLTSTSSAASLDSETQLDDSCATEDPFTAGDDLAITEDCIQQFLEEQQVAWEDATSTETDLSLDPPQSIDHQMICDIQAIAGRLASKSRQLLGKSNIQVYYLVINNIVWWAGNFTTNLAEGYMNVRSKFDGGKQINRSQRGAWKGRCAGAGLRINEGPAWGPAMWEKITSTAPSTTFTAVATARVLQTDKDRERKAQKEVKER